MSDVLYHEVPVIGGGLAGLRAAIAAQAAGVDVAVLSKVCPIRSHSGAARGGVNAALGNHPEGCDDDRWLEHSLASYNPAGRPEVMVRDIIITD
jgi:succinate dehydrogenase / fumarate reductase flavoprotein subunit